MPYEWLNYPSYAAHIAAQFAAEEEFAVYQAWLAEELRREAAESGCYYS